MKKIKVINEENKETKTLTSLYIDDEKFCLSDKEIINLLEEIYNAREDLLKELPLVKNLEYRLDYLEEELQDELDSLDDDEDEDDE